jgi:hypothetical protein
MSSVVILARNKKLAVTHISMVERDHGGASDRPGPGSLPGKPCVLQVHLQIGASVPRPNRRRARAIHTERPQ